MLVARKAAFKVLPLMVVAWATLAIVGGAVNLVNETKLDQGSVAKAGLGLCAVSVALLAGKRVRRLVPPAPAWNLRLAFVPLGSPGSGIHCGPPPTGPPIFRLLRISRT